MELVYPYHGCLSLVGDKINTIANYWIKSESDSNSNFIKGLEARNKRDGDNFHITVISAQECKNLNIQKVSFIDDLCDCGIGDLKDKEGGHSYFVPIYSVELQKIRKNYGLPPKDFHITLSFLGHDVHTTTLSKTIKTVTDTKKNFFVQQKIKDFLKSSPIIYTDVAESLYNRGYVSGLFYIAKKKLKSIGLKNTYLYIRDEINGASFKKDNEQEYIEKILNILNHSITVTKLEDRFEKIARYYTINEIDNDHYGFKYCEMPRNFSFVNEKIGGSSIFTKREQFEAMCKLGVTDVITIMETPLNKELYDNTKLDYHWYEVEDFYPPTTEQMREIMHIIQKSTRTVVHCRGGVGRTATVLAAWLMWTQKLSRQEAMEPILKERKTNLRDIQEKFLSDWYFECRKQEQIKSLTIKLPSVIVTVGYPSSGKSTFSGSLVDAGHGTVIRLNQDEDGRKKCETEFGKLSKKQNQTVILDRCNLTKRERKEWLSLAMTDKIWCIYFDVDIEECKWRIVRREGHPTIKKGSGTKILNSLEGTLEPPEKTEGFEKIITLRTFEEVNKLLTQWGCQIPKETLTEDHFIKFPRTRHVANLGSATRDDLIMDKNEVANFLHKDIYVEEKIDGANLGISIKDNKIMIQNRSHYVNSSYHPQFKYLDKWVHQNSSDLWEILQSEKHILYGEWLYARHSIGYQSLPDLFIAFDMYDILENKFWSRNRLEKLLENTNIFLVPLIAHKSFNNVDELKSLVKTESLFYDGPVEGVYLRIMDTENNWLSSRGKIVRSDFLSGNTHWSKGILHPNTFKNKNELS